MKTVIKTIVVPVLMFMATTGQTQAQGIPVYDNTNFISLVKQIFESAKQTSEMIKTVKFLKQAKETIEKVNNAVKQYEAVKEITENNKALVNMVRRDLKGILNSPYIRPDEVEAVSDAFNTIIDGSLSNLEFMEQVLSNDFLKLNDAERLAILEAQRDDSKKMVADITLKNKRYLMVISFREMQDKINNRETNY
ncbi:conjugal transfer protein [Pricia sp. S334]|uniref:Conjugal transfer protein n=1 Tax=Pricia mediterranea TaxID=3076079 RepID=A0ABU3L4R3_9FLAO|nr:conjugal transfer protein [Pricia sp. S334]MDT7828373.1 conjugal transfer protein [Pricia sp. S334]